MPATRIEPEVLSDRDLRAIVRLVHERAGIALHNGKRALVTSRLQRRVRACGFRSLREYVAHVVADPDGEEVVALLDAIATNHTAFFREPQHFRFLADVVLPAFAHRVPDIWSAACATGEEPYSIAMTLADALPAERLGQVRVLASDLSTRALRTAAAGVYPIRRLSALDHDLRRRHFERGLGAHEGLARVNRRARSLVRFERVNLATLGETGRQFDVIFCRNVMIYFDRAVQQRVVTALERHLRPGGWLFISHAESLNGLRHGLRWVAPAIYQRNGVS